MNQNKLILAVVAGRQRLGYSVFQGRKLVYYGLTSLSRFKTRSITLTMVERFLNKTVSRFQIEQIAVRDLSKSQKNSGLLFEITKHIKVLCRKKRIETSWLKGVDVNRVFCNSSERPTNDKTAEFLANRYPELGRYRNQTQIWQKKYYEPLFQAIALGLVCTDDYKNNEEIHGV